MVEEEGILKVKIEGEVRRMVHSVRLLIAGVYLSLEGRIVRRTLWPLKLTCFHHSQCLAMMGLSRWPCLCYPPMFFSEKEQQLEKILLLSRTWLLVRT